MLFLCRLLGLFCIYIENQYNRSQQKNFEAKLRHIINIKYANIDYREVIVMKYYFIKSLQMIKILNIKKQSEYELLVTYFLVLSPESLRYIAQKETFAEIVEMAKYV